MNELLEIDINELLERGKKEKINYVNNVKNEL